MVTLWFHRPGKVLLAQFSGTFSMEDVIALDSMVPPFLRSFAPIRGLLDFSGVDQIAITAQQVAARGKVSTLVPDQERIIVAAAGVGYGLARMFAAYQAATGNREPQIVSTLEEAYDLLGLSNPAFEVANETVAGSVDQAERSS